MLRARGVGPTPLVDSMFTRVKPDDIIEAQCFLFCLRSRRNPSARFSVGYSFTPTRPFRSVAAEAHGKSGAELRPLGHRLLLSRSLRTLLWAPQARAGYSRRPPKASLPALRAPAPQGCASPSVIGTRASLCDSHGIPRESSPILRRASLTLPGASQTSMSASRVSTRASSGLAKAALSVPMASRRTPVDAVLSRTAASRSRGAYVRIRQELPSGLREPPHNSCDASLPSSSSRPSHRAARPSRFVIETLSLCSARHGGLPALLREHREARRALGAPLAADRERLITPDQSRLRRVGDRAGPRPMRMMTRARRESPLSAGRCGANALRLPPLRARHKHVDRVHPCVTRSTGARHPSVFGSTGAGRRPSP